MAETICAGVTHRESEFAEVLAGVRVYGACGPNALSAVASNALGAIKHTSDVYWLMANAGLCDSEGVTTLASLATAAGKLGLTQVAMRGYTDPPWSDWQTFFTTFAGAAPFIAQIGYGQQLVDTISGDGENANNLRSHFICVLGRNTGGWSPHANRNLPAGFWCADGASFAGGNNNSNNFNAADVLQFYPDSVMGNALPTGALVIQGVHPMAWHRTANGAQDDKGHTVGTGMADAIFGANLQNVDGLMSETYYAGAASFAPLANGEVIRWDGHQVTWDGASVVVALWNQVQSLQQQLQQGGGGGGGSDAVYIAAIKAMKAAIQAA